MARRDADPGLEISCSDVSHRCEIDVRGSVRARRCSPSSAHLGLVPVLAPLCVRPQVSTSLCAYLSQHIGVNPSFLAPFPHTWEFSPRLRLWSPHTCASPPGSHRRRLGQHHSALGGKQNRGWSSLSSYADGF